MSQRLVKHLLGQHFDQLNRRFSLDKRGPLAWYPSAGEDFRDLLYTHEAYIAKFHPDLSDNYQRPGIFLHNDIGSDYHVHQPHGRGISLGYLYHDKNTSVVVDYVQPLAQVRVPLTEAMVDFRNPCQQYGDAYFMYLRVYSSKLPSASFHVPLIYIFAENLSLYRDVMRPHQAQFSHIIKVNQGAGMGGGTSNGSWMNRILNETKCRYYYTDPMLYNDRGDEYAISHLAGLELLSDQLDEFTKVSSIAPKYWSYKGDVTLWRRL